MPGAGQWGFMKKTTSSGIDLRALNALHAGASCAVIALDSCSASALDPLIKSGMAYKT